MKINCGASSKTIEEMYKMYARFQILTVVTIKIPVFWSDST
jgi:hypothetical protein